MKKIILILAILLFTVQAWGADRNIYISSTTDPAEDGSITHPYDSFSDINWTTGGTNSIYDWVAADDDVIINYTAGSLLRESPTLGTDGTAAHPITIQKSGSGSNPVLSGSQVIANSGFSKTSERTNVYEISFDLASFGNLEPMVWEDDTRLTEQSSVADVDSNAGSFYYVSGTTTMYVHASNSSSVITNSKVYEFPLLTENIVIDQDYIIFDGIDCIKTAGDTANTTGGITVTGDNNIIRNLSSHNHRRHSFIFYTGAAGNTATNLNLYDTYVSAVAVFYGAGCTGNTLSNSSIYNGAANANLYLHGSANDNFITGNHIYNNSDYLELATPLVLIDTTGNVFRNNKIDGYCTRYGFRSEGADNQFIGNILDGTNIDQNLFYVVDATGQEVYNNIFMNGAASWYDISITGTSTGCKVKNNICKDSGRFINVAAGNNTDFESDYNNVYNMSVRFGSWLGTLTAALSNWQTASSQDANSITTDPLLVQTWKLKEDSPAIGTGVDITDINDGGELDIWGNAARVGDINIGAYYGYGMVGGGGNNMNLGAFGISGGFNIGSQGIGLYSPGWREGDAPGEEVSVAVLMEDGTTALKESSADWFKE